MIEKNLFIKRAIKSAAAAANGVLPSKKAHGSVTIFAYHRVAADIVRGESDAYYGLVVSTETFRKHCEIIRRSFNVVSMDEATAILQGRTKPKGPSAVLTFDDGYLDFYDEAFPVLKSMDLPATMYLPTRCIGKVEPLAHDRLFWLLKCGDASPDIVYRSLQVANVSKQIQHRFANAARLTDHTELLVHLSSVVREQVIRELEQSLPNFGCYPDEYRLMEWEHVGEMARHRIEFGGHTATHVVLTQENHRLAEIEINESFEELDSKLPSPPRSFAYPNGEYDPVIRELISKAGFRSAVTTKRATNSIGADVLALGRTSLCEESTRGLAGVFSPRVAALRFGVSPDSAAIA